SALRDRDQQNLALLQTLSVVATPAHISQLADLPTAPNPHRTAFYVVLGAVLGLLVGIVAAFVRESFDRTVRRPDQVSTELGLPILSQLGHANSSIFAETESESARAEVGRLRRNLELLDLDRRLRTVLVTSAGPEEGKTTVAASLASAFARIGRRTLLLEADLRRPVLATRLNLRAEPGLSDCLRGKADLSDALQHLGVGSLAKADDGEGMSLACLISGTPVREADELLTS